MMKLLTPVRVMTNPLSQPSAAPSVSAPAMARGIGNPSVCMSQPPVITAQTPIEPTERFMPPVASAAICAKPMTMSTASARPTVKRLNDDTNPGARQENTTQKATMMIRRPNWEDATPTLKRRRAGSSLTASSVMPIVHKHRGTNASVADLLGDRRFYDIERDATSPPHEPIS